MVLYEWLSGTLPFRGSFTELCSQHLFVAPPPLHDKVPGISPAIEAVVEKAMAKDPQNRYPSVQDMATAFEEACQAEEETTVSGIAPTVRRPAAAALANDAPLAPTQYERTLPPTVKSSTEGVSIPVTEEASCSHDLGTPNFGYAGETGDFPAVGYHGRDGPGKPRRGRRVDLAHPF